MNNIVDEGECYPGYEDAPTLGEVLQEMREEWEDRWDDYTKYGDPDPEMREFGGMYTGSGRSSTNARNRIRDLFADYGPPASTRRHTSGRK